MHELGSLMAKVLGVEIIGIVVGLAQIPTHLVRS